jgi:hypothetical protein
LANKRKQISLTLKNQTQMDAALLELQTWLSNQRRPLTPDPDGTTTL